MIDKDIKKIAVLFINKNNSSQWCMVFDVGVDKYLVRLRDYINAAICHPTLQDMRNVGITEIRGDQHDGVPHKTIINRWL